MALVNTVYQKVPFSMTFPISRPITTITSADLMVESLCATTSTVFPFISSSKASCTSFSEWAVWYYCLVLYYNQTLEKKDNSLSRADVASSKIKICSKAWLLPCMYIKL